MCMWIGMTAICMIECALGENGQTVCWDFQANEASSCFQTLAYDVLSTCGVHSTYLLSYFVVAHTETEPRTGSIKYGCVFVDASVNDSGMCQAMLFVVHDSRIPSMERSTCCLADVESERSNKTEQVSLAVIMNLTCPVQRYLGGITTSQIK